MKTLFIFFLLLTPMFLINVQAQEPSCCNENAITKFSGFSNDKNFVALHVEPGNFVLQGGSGNMIIYNTPDGKTANGYEVKAETPTNKYLFLFHEWYGLNDYIKNECEYWSKELGVNTIGIDLYDGKVATTNEEATQYIQQMDVTRGENIIAGARNYADANTDNTAILATLGWCFGGGWSCQASILLEDKSKACVMYYGMPEENKDRLAKLTAPVLGIFASKDAKINAEVVKNFEDNMKSLGKSLITKTYEAEHGFANPSGQRYNSEATADAKKLTSEFLMTNFK